MGHAAKTGHRKHRHRRRKRAMPLCKHCFFPNSSPCEFKRTQKTFSPEKAKFGQVFRLSVIAQRAFPITQWHYACAPHHGSRTVGESHPCSLLSGCLPKKAVTPVFWCPAYTKDRNPRGSFVYVPVIKFSRFTKVRRTYAISYIQPLGASIVPS